MLQTRVEGLGTGSSRSGRTLLELVIVLALVGLLVRLAYVKFDGFRNQAKLRSSAHRLHQILSWAKLEAERRGDTLLIQVNLPQVQVWVDKNANGTVESATDTRILLDSLESSVQLTASNVTPPTAAAAAPVGTLDDDTSTCSATVCCEAGRTSGKGTWKWAATAATPNNAIAVCARTFPAMPAILEGGTLYLGSSYSAVKERWAVQVYPAMSPNPTLWTSAATPTARADWSLVR